MEEEILITNYDVHFFEIAKKHIQLFFEYDNILKNKWIGIEDNTKKFDEDFDEEYFKKNEKLLNEAAEARNRRDESGHIVIVFSSMCLEAIINHYAIIKLSKSYFENHLDRINIKNKWILIPKLILNKDFNKDSQAYEFLDKLIKNRNDLVHYKSRILKITPELKKQKEEEEKEFIQNVKDAINSIYLVTEALYKMDSGWSEYQFFDRKRWGNSEIQKYI